MSKILHISNTDVQVDSRIRKELEALGHLSGVHISVLGISETNETGDVELDGARYRRIRVASRRLRVFPRAFRYLFELVEFTFKAAVAGLRARPEIVHCHDTFALPAGWFLKKRLGCRLVYDAHELESRKNAQNAVLSWATLSIEKFCWKQIDLLISVSDSIIGWYMRELGPKPSVLVLNSPVISEESDRRQATQNRGAYFRAKYGIPTNRLIFVYVGMLIPGRGIEMCLEAFASDPDGPHVVFLGFGNLEQTVVAYSRLHRNIHFHEAVPHDQVVRVVRDADFGLCMVENASLSDYYCLPNKLFEYCFARIPVLASNFPEISRLVEQYSLGVCCDPNLPSMRTMLMELTRRGASRIESDLSALSWGTQAERLKNAYRDQLLDQSGSAPM